MSNSIEYNGTLICSAAQACRDIDIQNYKGNIFCEGKDSCKYATIYSRNDVYCSGWWSCSYSNIVASGNIYCSGKKGCYRATINSTGDGSNLTVYLMGWGGATSDFSIYCKKQDFCRIIQKAAGSSNDGIIQCDGLCILECDANFDCPLLITNNPTSVPSVDPTFNPTAAPTDFICNEAFSCFNLTKISNTGDLPARGYKSAAITELITISEGTGFIACYGAYSCLEVQTISNEVGDIYFGGVGSGFNVSLISTSSGIIYCRGTISCSYSNLQRTSQLNCHGDMDCYFASIIGVDSIWANGGYSLKNATIDSLNSSGTITIYFHGYQSGYGTLVLCQMDHICNIHCYGDSCDYLHSDGVGTINFIYQNTIEPNEVLDTIFFYDTLSLSETNENNCNTVNGYDDYNEFYGFDVIDGDVMPFICCRGQESCNLATKIQFNGTNGTSQYSIICTGTNSCRDVGLIKNNGDIFCTGFQACMTSNIEAQNLYCLSRSACAWSTITASGNIFCSGSASCWESNITSAGNGSNLTIYSIGWNGIQNANIYCLENDFCTIIQAAPVDAIATAATVYCIGECDIQCAVSFNCPNIISADPTESPTFSPSVAPTIPPTLIPTITPSLNPSISPSFAPTVSPSAAPTTCYDADEYTNDGFELNVDDQIKNLMFPDSINNISKILIADELFEHDDAMLSGFSQIICNGSLSCYTTTIKFKDDTKCYLECSGDMLSCSNSIIDVDNCEYTHIICNGTNACDQMIVTATSLSSSHQIIIDCGVATSCDDLTVNIYGNLQSVINCFDLNACDGLFVYIEAE
eukprot:539655_1